MQYRVVGISEAAVAWSLNDGDVVSERHPAFAADRQKFLAYLAAGHLVPIDPAPETTMLASGENAMRPRPRGRPRTRGI